MNERIKEMYKEAEKSVAFLSNSNESKQLIIQKKFAELVAAYEREACAKVCESIGRGHGSAIAEFDCAEAIRVRGR